MTAAPTWLWVALFGATGTLLRYALGLLLVRPDPRAFPWATFAVNIAGCAAIGVASGIFERTPVAAPALRTALMVGLLGGFTTFSSFALDGLRMASAGYLAGAVVYVVSTNVLGFAVAWLGHRVGHGHMH
jgi:CrcB protein